MNRKSILLSVTILTIVLLAGCGQEQVAQTQQLPNKKTIKKIVNVESNQNNYLSSSGDKTGKTAKFANDDVNKNPYIGTKQVQEGNEKIINVTYNGERPGMETGQDKIEPEPKLTKLTRAEEGLFLNKDSKVEDLNMPNNTDDIGSNNFRDINDYIFELDDTYSTYSQYIDINNKKIKKEYEPYRKQFANEIYNVLRKGKKIKVDDPVKKQQLVNSFHKLKELYNILNY